MYTKAIYPGTFDPITNGHIDLVRRAAEMFDHVVVAIASNPSKTPLFMLEERVELAEKAVKNIKNASVVGFSGLLANLAKEQQARILLRGLRAVSDFEYEFQLAGMNKKLNSKIETMFLMSDIENQIISSKFVKEIVGLGGNIDRFVTRSTVKMLKNKI